SVTTRLRPTPHGRARSTGSISTSGPVTRRVEQLPTSNFQLPRGSSPWLLEVGSWELRPCKSQIPNPKSQIPNPKSESQIPIQTAVTNHGDTKNTETRCRPWP